MSELKAVNNHVTCYQVISRSMESSMHLSYLTCTYLILHFTMLIEDLWKFPCTCLDQFKIDHLSFFRINRRSM